MMEAMLREQADRARGSRENAKKKPETVVSAPVDVGSTRVFREVDPADLRPSAFRNQTEDVVANSDDEGGKFEKRKDEGVGRI